MPFDLSDLFKKPEDEENQGLNITQQPLPVEMMPDAQASTSPPSLLPEQTPPQAQPYQIQNPSVKDYMAQLYGDKYSDSARDALQAKAQEDASGPNFGAALASLGAGLSGRDAAAAGNTYLKSQQDMRNAPLVNFDKARQSLVDNAKTGMTLQTNAQDQDRLMRERDPSSVESQAAQQAALKMGIKPEIANKMTAEQFKAQGPIFEKMFQVEQARLGRQDMANARKDAQTASQQARNDKLNDDLFMKMKDDLDPNKARGGNLAKNQSQIDQADRLKGLYTEANGDLRNLDSRQMEELAIGMNKMLSGSSAGSTTQVEALLPHTIRGDSQKLKEWLMNDPRGTNQQAFVARMAETVDREKSIAEGQVRNAQVQRLSAYSKLKDRDPQRYGQLLNAYGIDQNDIDEKGRYTRSKEKELVNENVPVKIRDPKGVVRLIPKSQVKAALAAGGTVMNTNVAENSGSY